MAELESSSSNAESTRVLAEYLELFDCLGYRYKYFLAPNAILAWFGFRHVYGALQVHDFFVKQFKMSKMRHESFVEATFCGPIERNDFEMLTQNLRATQSKDLIHPLNIVTGISSLKLRAESDIESDDDDDDDDDAVEAADGSTILTKKKSNYYAAPRAAKPAHEYSELRYLEAIGKLRESPSVSGDGSGVYEAYPIRLRLSYRVNVAYQTLQFALILYDRLDENITFERRICFLQLTEEEDIEDDDDSASSEQDSLVGSYKERVRTELSITVERQRQRQRQRFRL